MKIMGRAADFCGTKEKREKNERMISMVKKANAFFYPGSPFLFLSFFPHDFHRKGENTMGHPFRSIGYLIFAFLLVLYGLPRLPFLAEKNEAVVFSAIWIGFALLIIGVHLYQIIREREGQDTVSSLVAPQREQAKKRTQFDYE
jgi:hypothetical protein